ncbi:MAG: bifunctional riboflavin kinase/FMN adenylyltransferase [Rickettsiales bacterium]|nr:bifunctional riboflavin kinase/FMN adenylyltransferase [Rickettsiales bacterium]
MVKVYRDFQYAKKFINKSTVAIGNFDGVHLGHLSLLKKAKKLASNSNTSFTILTFAPHPLKVLRPEFEPKSILRFRTKIEMLERAGVEIVLAQRFTKSFSKITAEKFVYDVLKNGLKAKNVVVGDDFKFGYKREGDISYLVSKEFSEIFKVHIINEISGKYGRYSSSSIRGMISSGDMLKVKESLGYFYIVEGRVVSGEKLGRELGFPTANIHYNNNVIPEDGIYAGWVLHEKKQYMAAISTGIRPQFKGKKRFLEAYLINFNGNLYGKNIKVSLVKKIRDEKVFSDIEKMKLEMKHDCDKALNILNKYKI